MKILIFGGTRFVGKSLVKKLIENNHSVTVVSKSNIILSNDIIHIKSKKENSYKLLKNINSYDFIIDFIAYTPKDIEGLFKFIGDVKYIMISTLWINHLESSNERIFFDYELNYVKNKKETEKIIIKRHGKLKNSYIFRAPIIMGPKDHTGRLFFYHKRISFDNYPFLYIDQKFINTSFLYKDDFVNLIYNFIINLDYQNDCIFDILPRSKISIYPELIKFIKKIKNVKKEQFIISPRELKLNFPEFYNLEPYFRETEFKLINKNLIDLMNFKETSYKDIILRSLENKNFENNNNIYNRIYGDLRTKEIEFIKSNT